MVSEKMRYDFGRATRERTALLAVGDHCQLPPVEGRPGFDLEHATARLDRIHRQAEGSPVLVLSQAVREARLSAGGDLQAAGQRVGVRTVRVSLDQLARQLARQREADVAAIMVTNKARVWTNHRVRVHAGLPGFDAAGPQVGEKIVVVRTACGVGAGETGTVVSSEVGPEPLVGFRTQHCQIDFGHCVKDCHVPLEGWRYCDPARGPAWEAKGEHLRDVGALTRKSWAQLDELSRDYSAENDLLRQVVDSLLEVCPGYAITAWKAQGSQWVGGAVVLEPLGWMKQDAWRVVYTAVTRFRERLTLIEPTSAY